MRRMACLLLLAFLLVFPAGCGQKEEEFRLTYSAGSDLYLAVGYGAQSSGGYSIQVKELYLTENGIVLDTELLGLEETVEPGAEGLQQESLITGASAEEPLESRRETYTVTRIAVQKRENYRISEELENSGNKLNLGEILWREVDLRSVDCRPLDGALAIRGRGSCPSLSYTRGTAGIYRCSGKSFPFPFPARWNCRTARKR